LGGTFLGAVGSVISGLIVAITVTDLQYKLSVQQQYGVSGVSLSELLPSIVASVIGAIFIVYVMGLFFGQKNDKRK
jgi:hypothetical protein